MNTSIVILVQFLNKYDQPPIRISSNSDTERFCHRKYKCKILAA